MERFHVKIRRAMGTMNRFTERDSPESQRVSYFQRCGTRLPHLTPLTRCGSATRGPTMRFMERGHFQALNVSCHHEPHYGTRLSRVAARQPLPTLGDSLAALDRSDALRAATSGSTKLSVSDRCS